MSQQMSILWITLLLMAYVRGEWDVWTCGHYDVASSSWLWSCDGQPLSATFEIWAPGSPPTFPTGNMAIYMSDAHEFAFDVTDEETGIVRFMCEIVQDPCPAGWGRIIYGSTHCWKMKGKWPAPNWQEARADCQAEGADLSSINSQQEYEAIRDWLLPNVPAPLPTPAQTTAPTPAPTTDPATTAIEETTFPETTLSDTTFPNPTTQADGEISTVANDVPTTPGKDLEDTLTTDITISDLSTASFEFPSTVLHVSTNPQTKLDDSGTVMPTAVPYTVAMTTTVGDIKQPTVNLRISAAVSDTTVVPDNLNVSGTVPPPPPLVSFLRTAPPPVDSQVEDVDKRASAIAIGVSWLFMCLIFAIFVCVLDSTSWYRDCRKLRRNISRISKIKRK